MSQSEPAPAAGRGQRYVLTTGAVARPVAERPTKDSLDAIAEWLVGAAREISSGLHGFDEFAWRMLAAGLPLLQVTLHNGTLHPQFLGTTFTRSRTSGRSEQALIAHEIMRLIQYEDNPVQRVCIGGETLRRRLDGLDATLDFAVLRDLKARSATDYLALPIRSVHRRNHVLSDDFACAYAGPLISLGHHPLRGLAKQRELFAPTLDPKAICFRSGASAVSGRARGSVGPSGRGSA